ncbi:hypothetical protein LXA43DRAFT_1078464 [Ganoderma leucocontextum]|nr:hypothetical protein LXA43DRAFT_1078464 [Ganoderma leucocontextum]
MLNSLPREVLDEICRALSHPPFSTLRSEGRKRRQTLASLARTCCFLHEPAVCALWHTIHNIRILTRTLPEDLWPGSLLPDLVGAQSPFSRPPVQSDFARLKHYAHRIKHITYASTSLIALNILDALAIHFPPGTLLPNIRTLRCRWFTSMSSETYQLLLLQALVGPKLRSLHLICSVRAPSQAHPEPPGPDNLDCMRTLPRICPALSELTIRADLDSSAPHIAVLSDVIRGFQDLTSVVVRGIPLDFEAILHLATLRNLKTLHANPSDSIIKANYQSLISTSTGVQTYFPSLQMLHLNNRFLFLCTLLLTIVSSPVLDAVTFTTSPVFGFYCTSKDVTDLCVELSRHTSLTSITVAVHSMLTGACLDRTTFKPLLLLPNVRHLDINVGHMIAIDNAFLNDMALAWRKLVRLEFCVEHPCCDRDGYSPATTLLGLIPFALLCPELEVLGIPINTDMSTMPPNLLERCPGRGAVASNVYQLEVGLSIVNDPVPVAAFLSDLFPNLRRVYTAWTDDMEDAMDGDIGTPEEIRERWDEVALLVGSFRNVRRQERIWAAAHGKSQSDVAGTYTLQ